MKQLDLLKLNQKITAYLWQGYDLYFIHGWFCSYLSAPSDSEDDLIIPSYLIINEDAIKDEQQFSNTIDELIKLYSEIAETIFEHNKLIKPLINLETPNNFDANIKNEANNVNLVKWLYGYLTGYLAIGADITDYCKDEELLENKFFPALFAVCICFFKLVNQVELNFMSKQVLTDFEDMQKDLLEMWESEDDENIYDKFVEAGKELGIAELVGSINDIFYVVRMADEQKVATPKVDNSLINKLSKIH